MICVRPSPPPGRRDPDPAVPVMLVYMLFMLTGQTALDDLQNDCYPAVDPELFADVAQRVLVRCLPDDRGARSWRTRARRRRHLSRFDRLAEPPHMRST
jgi:hypothetical protein